MNIHLFIVSIIEGLTEFLPISSTAHLIIAAKFMNLDLMDEYIQFYLLFIQLGALLAGLVVFLKNVFDKKVFTNIVISFIPTSIIGLLLYKVFKHLLEGNFILMAIMLLLGGLVFIYLEKKYIPMREVGSDRLKPDITHTDAFVIGVAQALAIVPGVSRSGITIIAGLFRKIQKQVIIQYTFLLALPTLGAAVAYDFYKSRAVFAQINSYSDLIYGFVVAFIFGYITLLVIKKYLPKISLTAFGWYRILLAIIVLITLV